MGNCQAAEAATVVIEHPGGRAERFYWSLSASQVMADNPGHYVAALVSTSAGDGAAALRHLKLLRPDDTLCIGHVYRLISFEDVLKELATKKHIKLSRLLVKHEESTAATKRGGRHRGGGRTAESSPKAVTEQEQEQEQQQEEGIQNVAQVMVGSSTGRIGGGGTAVRHSRQWRPALQSIAEQGS